MDKEITEIAISWHRLPPYAAHLIAAGIKAINLPVHVVASKPLNLLSEVESIINQPIYWVDSSRSCSWASLGLSVPRVFFQSGWLSQAFKQLGEEVKQAGGRVICFSDNSWKNSPRQWLGAVAFRLKYRDKFDAAWVPGQSGANLMNFYGMPKGRVYQGMYGSNPHVFRPGVSLEERPKRLIFVGQLIDRKGISTLLQAFQNFRQQFPDWKLHIIGSGPLYIPSNDPAIECEGFSSPNHVADAMRNSRFLILPSLEDHWGLVVHEAACSGCGLIVSKTVGAAPDLVTRDNGYAFKTSSVESLTIALIEAAKKDVRQLQIAHKTSLSLASQFGTNIWPEVFKTIINDLGTNHQRHAVSTH